MQISFFFFSDFCTIADFAGASECMGFIASTLEWGVILSILKANASKRTLAVLSSGGRPPLDGTAVERATSQSSHSSPVALFILP